MKGKAIITNGNGWACSNEAITNNTDIPVRDFNGKIVSVKRTISMTVKDAYHVCGGVSVDDDVDVAFLTSDKRVSFRGRITGSTGNKTEISLTSVCGSDHTKALITKIKLIGGN